MKSHFFSSSLLLGPRKVGQDWKKLVGFAPSAKFRMIRFSRLDLFSRSSTLAVSSSKQCRALVLSYHDTQVLNSLMFFVLSCILFTMSCKWLRKVANFSSMAAVMCLVISVKSLSEPVELVLDLVRHLLCATPLPERQL